MPYSIVELLPVAQYSALGYTPPNAQTPAVFGSVSDNSDATVTTLEAEYQTGGARYSEVLTLDFALPDPTMLPQFMHMRIRARDNAEFVANPDAFLTIYTDYSLVEEAPGNPYDQWAIGTSGDAFGQLGDLAHREVADPTWLDFSYLGNATPVDTANPGDTWFAVNPDGSRVAYYHAYGLAGAGIRFTLYPRAESNLVPRTSFLDVFEVRMVVAYVQTAAPYVPPTRATPSLRMLQRGGQGGMSGIPRMIGNPVRGLRQGPGSVY